MLLLHERDCHVVVVDDGLGCHDVLILSVENCQFKNCGITNKEIKSSSVHLRDRIPEMVVVMLRKAWKKDYLFVKY